MRVPSLVILAGLAASPSMAATAPLPSPFAVSSERHFTSNALDGPLAVADWYTLLRASLQRTFETDAGTLRLGTEFQVKRFDHTDIEDDGALALAAELHTKLSPRLELRGALTYSVSSDGDDLTIGSFVLGTRTIKHVIGGKAELGIDLGAGTSLVVGLGDQLELLGDTHFDLPSLRPTKLDPDRNRTEISARVTHMSGETSYGVSASTAFVAAETLGSPPAALSFQEYTLRLETAAKGKDGSSLGMAFGVQWLRGAHGSFAGARPTYHLVAAKPLPKGFEIRGSLTGRFETADTDDPLASWLNRAEFEAARRIGERLRLGIGAFAEIKRNLLLENWQRERGLYAEASYDLSKPTTLVLRVDLSDTFASIVDVRYRTVDFFIGLRTKM